MPDIFLSYNREDQAAARRFAEAFEAHGFSVWWDVTLRSGEAYDQVTEKALREAKAVVVLWSKKSVESRWVRAEATLAERYKTLVPAMIEPCDRPIMFELTQTAELFHWQGDVADKVWLAFLGDVRRFVDAQGGSTSSAPAAKLPAEGSARGGSRPNRVAIAVLPFANMSGDSEQEYFSDGISEDIITDLSKVSALSVISRNSAFTFKGKHVDLPQVARQLDVTHVLEGSVRKAGNRVRITAQLIDGASNDHVWAERYDRDLADIFAVQDEISQAIVAALKLKLFPEEKKAIETSGTTSLEAYDKYLRARGLMTSFMPADLLRAASMFQEVLAIDPDFSQAYGSLAMTYAHMLTFLPEQHERTFKEMDDAVKHAFARAPDQWGTHFARGLLLMVRHDWLAADEAFAKVLANVPRSETDPRLMAAMFLAAVGRVTEAIKVLEEARAVDPLAAGVSSILQQEFDIAGRPRDAQAEYERTRDIGGNREAAEHAALMRIWDSSDEAAIEARFRRFLDSRTVPIPIFEKVLDALDQPAVARGLLAQAFEDPVNQDSTRCLIIGWHAAHFGDDELAIAGLRRSYIDMHGPLLMQMWLPVLRNARQTQSFKRLLRDLGIYDYWRASGKWGDFARPLGPDDFECW